MKLSNQQTALLGLLCEADMHAYQIEKEVEERSMRDWTDLSMSAIYKTLKALETDGYTQSEVRLTDQNVAQKVHRITPAGRAALAENVRKLFREPVPVKDPTDLAFNNLFVLSPDDALHVLAEYRAAVERLCEGYGNLHDYLVEAGCPTFRMALADRRQALLKGELQWIDSYIQTIEKYGIGNVVESPPDEFEGDR